MKKDNEHVAYLSLGSNIESRYDYLTFALKKLRENPNITIVKQSSIYETEPIGVINQAAFLNMAVKISTSYSPSSLLIALQKIEQQGNRTRDRRWGPRTIDLDILLFNKENINLEHLQIPHPRMYERAFVLVPLFEIEPSIVFNNGKTIASYIDQLTDKEGVRQWKISSGAGESEHSES
ncbi:2-amino-4-hydroxy-6-hydroxymethyldihydropteridine diphosphokinase [Evansella cellulosilytica]|uniref:2-amino-4-hydroxy-6-hydroxymethyldihydropteridine diphosphokinase n=1 Tax=Evansella cellulosilytica (strain ATCC 21833 / DSM 2522 / FERM P-1141 / JCM 9156 / N-4) TaxID=649639 RepID=E6TSF5_EVAC2|nr:2-amino-4-hydroxy-6-hydroxymethyldihydropteridine diphosphokinase [Evansella cellulosilytica]ADU28370.1 2-amino-4-hydroxy-6-hydroxymethyldihydropteridine pyrophosphokinase [Evansella cellulosilytica DSM 2522]